MTQLFTAGLLIIHNRQLLLAYSSRKECYYLPGGKLDAGETAVQALCREAAEELAIFLERPSFFYTHITAPAYGETAGTVMEQDCFRVLKPVHPVATAEIEKIGWFTTSSYAQEGPQAPGAVMILAKLKADDLID
ncbi:MAG: NUDIX domain-containing protein [Chitinophagaceae bacterium]